MAPGLWTEKKLPLEPQDGKIRAPGDHSFSQGLTLPESAFLSRLQVGKGLGYPPPHLKRQLQMKLIINNTYI